jgi:hypothetical protein
MAIKGECVPNKSWLRRAGLAALLVVSFGCSEPNREEPAPQPDPNEERRVGLGFATIQAPSSLSAYTTDESSVTLSGSAFISPNNSIENRDTGVSVSWSSSTGAKGTAIQRVQTCSFFGAVFLCDHTWSAVISLSLGINTIRVTADDFMGGNFGSDGITITRISEHIPPSVNSTNPAANATNFPVNQAISATFSEEMDVATVTPATFSVRDSNGDLTAGSISIANRTAIFQPNVFLPAFTVHTATLSTAIKDISGNGLPAPFTWTFTTGNADVTPPAIVSVFPPAGSSCAAIDAEISVTFNESIDPTTLRVGTFTARKETPCCPGVDAVLSVDSDGRSAVLDPRFPLSLSTSYSARLFPDVKDLAGNAAPFFTWSFSTAADGIGSWQLKSMTGAPDGTFASAIWTGAEMIIFGGGSTTSTPTDVGVRFSPATSTWSFLPPGPAARLRHVAVWTGTEMIVWGGDGSTGPLNDGARYNPMTNTWSSMSVVDAPSARGSAQAVWTGSEMVVWGGSGTGGLSTDHAAYNPTSDTWRVLSSAGAPTPNQRLRHTAIWTGSRMIVWGGDTACFSSSCAVTTGGIYDPVTDVWQPVAVPDQPSARTEHSAVWTGTEMAIWGGRRIESAPRPISSGALYNPSTNSWRPISATCAPGGRYGHFAAWTGSELLIWGGGREIGGRYNPTTDTWQHMKRGPFGNIHTRVVWTSGQLLLWGGWMYSP